MKPQAKVDPTDSLTAWVTVKDGVEVMFCFTMDSETEEFVEFVNENCEYASI